VNNVNESGATIISKVQLGFVNILDLEKKISFQIYSILTKCDRFIWKESNLKKICIYKSIYFNVEFKKQKRKTKWLKAN